MKINEEKKRRIIKMAKIIAVFMAIITFFTIIVNKVTKPPVPEDPSTTTITMMDNSETTTKVSSTEQETTTTTTVSTTQKPNSSTQFTYSMVPAYSDEAYVIINNNVPYFEASEITTSVFETYSELDNLGRCGVAYANICKELMPTEDREEIGSVKPSGWTHPAIIGYAVCSISNNNKYDFVDGKYIYNRCHLIGFQLAGENANKKNLITGTRYLNIEGMLPFENMVADYVKETNNHVLYRVTPIFKDNELVARGVLMEGYSVEDRGEGIEFCAYAYNVQPGVEINYLTGQNYLSGTATTTELTTVTTGYVVNDNTMKIHKTTCQYATGSNVRYVSETLSVLEDNGYVTCKVCFK